MSTEFSDVELEIFAVARAAGEGLRRTFDTYVSIAAAVRIARDHADAPGGTKKVRGGRFRKIIGRSGPRSHRDQRRLAASQGAEQIA
jgi:hypothetical protein